MQNNAVTYVKRQKNPHRNQKVADEYEYRLRNENLRAVHGESQQYFVVAAVIKRLDERCGANEKLQDYRRHRHDDDVTVAKSWTRDEHLREKQNQKYDYCIHQAGHNKIEYPFPDVARADTRAVPEAGFHIYFQKRAYGKPIVAHLFSMRGKRFLIDFIRHSTPSFLPRWTRFQRIVFQGFRGLRDRTSR